MKTDKLKSSLIGLAKAVVNAALTALLAWLAKIMTGCTTVVVPNDAAETSAVVVTGAFSFGIQFNTGK